MLACIWGEEKEFAHTTGRSINEYNVTGNSIEAPQANKQQQERNYHTIQQSHLPGVYPKEITSDRTPHI